MLARIPTRLLSRTQASRAFATKVTLPPLDYGYEELQPYISKTIMEIHHSKHHATYVNNYNAALEKNEEALKNNNTALLLQVQQALKFNGGGHVNHTIFWKNLAPVGKGGGVLPEGPLKNAIVAKFGSPEKLKDEMNAVAVGVQGSGWAWLGYDKVNIMHNIYIYIYLLIYFSFFRLTIP